MSNLIISLLCLTLATGILANPIEESVIEGPKKREVKTASLDSFNFAEEQTKWISFEATAYTADCKGCIGITKTGFDVRDKSIDHRIVAVDPNIIALHSIVEIKGLGEYKALDIGGAIKGNRVDVLVESKAEAIEFGRQQVKLRVVERGVQIKLKK